MTASPEQSYRGSGLSVLRAVFGLAVRASGWRLAGYLFVTALAGVVPVATAWITKDLLDGIAHGQGLQASALARMAVVLALVGVVAAALPHVSQYLRLQLSQMVRYTSDLALYRAVNGFVGLRRFEDPGFRDELRMAQQSGGDAPGEVIDGVVGGLRTLITAVGFTAVLMTISPAMTLLVLVSVVPALVAEISLARQRAATAFGIGPDERSQMFYSNLLTSVQAAKELRLYDTSGFLLSRMMQHRRRSDAARRGLARRTLGLQGALALLSTAVVGVGLVWSVRAAARGEISVGDVAMFVAAVAGVQMSLGGAVLGVALAHQHLLEFRHYLAVTRSPAELPVPVAARPLQELREGIELRDVWFRYSDSHPWVLRGVDLLIPFGRTTALVGLNGAGKSTLVKLLCRFYDPTRGAILWDGVDIRDVAPAQLRARMCAVFQDYMNYDLPAFENIALGDLAHLDDRDRLEAAARHAGVHDVLAALPLGYDTMLSRSFRRSAPGQAADSDAADGVLLSGGQWQRVALARAFLRDQKDFLILDEPSSGLDAEAEYDLHRGISEHREGRTSLLISHRLGSIRTADLIVVLDEGVVIERGTHRDLVSTGGKYAHLFELQARGFQDDDAIAVMETAVMERS